MNNFLYLKKHLNQTKTRREDNFGQKFVQMSSNDDFGGVDSEMRRSFNLAEAGHFWAARCRHASRSLDDSLPYLFSNQNGLRDKNKNTLRPAANENNTHPTHQGGGKMFWNAGCRFECHLILSLDKYFHNSLAINKTVCWSLRLTFHDASCLYPNSTVISSPTG